MIEKGKTSRKPVGTREWYDFVGQLADALPGMHLGGQDATQTLLDMCHLDAKNRVLDVAAVAGTRPVSLPSSIVRVSKVSTYPR